MSTLPKKASHTKMTADLKDFLGWIVLKYEVATKFHEVCNDAVNHQYIRFNNCDLETRKKKLHYLTSSYLKTQFSRTTHIFKKTSHTKIWVDLKDPKCAPPPNKKGAGAWTPGRLFFSQTVECSRELLGSKKVLLKPRNKIVRRSLDNDS